MHRIIKSVFKVYGQYECHYMAHQIENFPPKASKLPFSQNVIYLSQLPLFAGVFEMVSNCFMAPLVALASAFMTAPRGKVDRYCIHLKTMFAFGIAFPPRERKPLQGSAGALAPASRPKHHTFPSSLPAFLRTVADTRNCLIVPCLPGLPALLSLDYSPAWTSPVSRRHDTPSVTSLWEFFVETLDCFFFPSRVIFFVWTLTYFCFILFLSQMPFVVTFTSIKPILLHQKLLLQLNK